MKERGMIFNEGDGAGHSRWPEDADPAAYQMETDSVH